MYTLPAGPAVPNKAGAFVGIVGSTKMGSVGKSVSGGGAVPPMPPAPPVPDTMRLSAAAGASGGAHICAPPLGPPLPVTSPDVGGGDDRTFAQANPLSVAAGNKSAHHHRSQPARIVHYNTNAADRPQVTISFQRRCSQPDAYRRGRACRRVGGQNIAGISPAVAVCPSEQQLKIAIIVLSGAVLAGGAALLSE